MIQPEQIGAMRALRFWSSVVLTGDPTFGEPSVRLPEFWSSVVLTGDPTQQRLR